MQSNIKDLPYGAIMKAVDRFKKEFFKRPWPEHAPSIYPEQSHAEIEQTLREQHFEGLYMSYIYDGQVLDLRQPVEGPLGMPFEKHIRTRDTDKGVELIGHIEASRYESKRAHINEQGFEWLREDSLRELVE